MRTLEVLKLPTGSRAASKQLVSGSFARDRRLEDQIAVHHALLYQPAEQ